MRRFVLMVSFVAAACAVAPPGPPGAYPPPPGAFSAPPRSEVVTEEDGRQLTLMHSAPGDPAVMGCADGHREAFLDIAAFPHIAGCLASWPDVRSLRMPPTDQPCGDEMGACEAPADACAPGWHLCGFDGSVAELRQITGEQCETAGGGRFSAAISHCKAQEGCQYDLSPAATYACFEQGWCSEPVCCGNDCGELGECTGGVWEGRTHIPMGIDQGCGLTSSRRAGGVLCCRGQ